MKTLLSIIVFVLFVVSIEATPEKREVKEVWYGLEIHYAVNHRKDTGRGINFLKDHISRSIVNARIEKIGI
jgi:hypothetical protein